MPSKLWRFIFSLALFAQLAGFLPGFTPKAQALWWEDDSSLSDPKEKVNRPSGFFLSDWINGLDKESKEAQYRDLENRDHGPSVNNGQKTVIIVTSGLVGLGGGLICAYTLTDASTESMFIGGALGICAGIGVGALIMPADYEVQESRAPEPFRLASGDFSFQQAWAQDPSRVRTQKAFQPTYPVLSLKL
ncbi:MAG TPA: hypothetical protein VMU88_02245 [bacterium]|nr:hypothetical protein [bacterium]